MILSTIIRPRNRIVFSNSGYGSKGKAGPLFSAFLILASFLGAAPFALAGSEESGRRLVLALDGVPYSMVRKMQEAGKFNSFFPVSRLISTFPSLTDCAFSEIFGAKPPAGYQRYYYSPGYNRFIGGLSAELAGPMEFELRMHVAFKSTLHHMKAYMAPSKTFRKELESAFDAFLASDEKYIYAYLLGPDAVLHMGGDLGAELNYLDGRMNSLQARYFQETGKKMEIVLLSDHGNTLVERGERVKVGRHLKDAGFRLSGKIKNEKDLAVPISGPVSSIAVYAKPSKIDRVALSLASLRGVDLVTSADAEKPDRIHVRNSVGEKAMIVKRNNAYAYRAIEGDPLAHTPLQDRLKKEGKLSAAGFASGDNWLKASSQSPYPAALERIFRGHREAALSPAPILVSLKPGYENVNGFIKGFYSLKFAGTHGGLAAEESNGILMTNFTRTPDLTTNRVPDFFKWEGFFDYREKRPGGRFVDVGEGLGVEFWIPGAPKKPFEVSIVRNGFSFFNSEVISSKSVKTVPGPEGKSRIFSFGDLPVPPLKAGRYYVHIRDDLKGSGKRGKAIKLNFMVDQNHRPITH